MPKLEKTPKVINPGVSTPTAKKAPAKKAPAKKVTAEEKAVTEPAKIEPTKVDTAKVENPKEQRDIKNGQPRPSSGTKTREIWDMADRLSSENKVQVSRSVLVDAVVKLGCNKSTAYIQYGRWCVYHGVNVVK